MVTQNRTNNSQQRCSLALMAAVAACWTTTTTTAWQHCARLGRAPIRRPRPLFLSSDWNDPSNKDSNLWRSSDEEKADSNQNDDTDWQNVLSQKQDGSFWSSFESSSSDDDDDDDNDDTSEQIKDTSTTAVPDEQTDADAWLDTIASLSAEEVEFNMKESARADTARQMQEWGFDAETIASSLDIAVDDTLEKSGEVDGMQAYRETAFWDDVDLGTVESHTQVETDAETGEPFRQQMVYVDEHTCIGCTNCAMIAQSTFYMNPEHGRARVFQQWGDDDETIQVAIETCPVDCIHYIPFDELVTLEKERRGQNINFKARLVSQAEFGNSPSHRVGGPNEFTAPQKISGNMGARCSNCPSRGCKNCPMFGVGKNPEFERKEKIRKESIAKRILQDQRELEQKSADL